MIAENQDEFSEYADWYLQQVRIVLDGKSAFWLPKHAEQALWCIVYTSTKASGKLPDLQESLSSCYHAAWRYSECLN